MQDRSNDSFSQSRQIQQDTSFSQQRNSYVVEGINNTNEISNFNCQWIDEEESPIKYPQQRFPSDIQIGMDGLNIGSGHHLQTNQIQFNLQADLSINNEYQQDEYFIKRKNKNQLEDNSILSNHDMSKNHGNMLGDQLDLLNDSKEGVGNILEISQTIDSNLFDHSDNLISQIQPPVTQNQQIPSNNSVRDIANEQNEKSNVSNIKINLTIQSQSSISEQKKQLQASEQTSQTLSAQQTLKSQENPSKSSIQKDSTVVINDNSFLSKIYDDMSSIEQSKLLKSMSNYLQSNQQVYNPLYSILEAIYTNSKIKSQKSMQNFNMYGDFFKEKTKQLEKYLRQMQSQKTQKLFQDLKTKEINNMVYIDSKVVLRDIHQKNIKKVKLYRVFYKQILEVSNELKKIIGQIHTKRNQSQKTISFTLSTVKSLESDLQKLIEYRVNYERHKQDPHFHINTKQLFKVDNPHIFKDHYLQIKFIIQKETTYINKLKILRTQIIKYITMIFLTDQIILSSKIKENLINFTQMLLQVQKFQRILKFQQQSGSQKEQQFTKDLESLQAKKDTLSQKKIHQQLKVELSKKLYECIPQILRKQLGINDFDRSLTSEQLLELMNSHFQNQVFFPNIELENEFIFYKTEGGWLSRDDYKALEMAGNRQIKASNQLKFVLTMNKYLHMEQNEKIATIKLNEIKISKKGKFIIINDRGKGIVGFLVNNGNELGRIQLNSAQEADKFAEKVKQLVQQK